jgi:hypothetical protein
MRLTGLSKRQFDPPSATAAIRLKQVASLRWATTTVDHSTEHAKVRFAATRGMAGNGVDCGAELSGESA